MSNFSGFVNAGVQLGLESLIIRPIRGLYGITNPDGSYLKTDADGNPEPIIAQATIEETHQDELEITDHPVELGAMISDHAFKHPSEVILRMGWSNSPSDNGNLINPAISAAAAVSPTVNAIANAAFLAQGVQSTVSGLSSNQMNDVYQQLLEIQANRALFVIYTGRRVYTNMVCKSLVVSTDYKSAHSLFVTMTCKQVILVNTQAVQLEARTQRLRNTASKVQRGAQNASQR